MAASSPALAYNKRCSDLYGPSATRACVTVDQLRVFSVLEALQGTAYNLTIVTRQCDGNGQNCVVYGSAGDSSGATYSYFSHSQRAVTQYHVYQAVGSWRDSKDKQSYPNAVSPFVVWNQ